MDALEFLRERKRMCNSYNDCKGCPLNDSNCIISSTISVEDCERILATAQDTAERVPGAVSGGSP